MAKPKLNANPFQTDPGYLAALAAEQAGSQQADAALKAAQEQAIVQFGDPSLAQSAGFALDPLTAAMAQQNTQAGNSTLAGLQRTRDQGQQSILANLAAHGMLESGQLGYATGQNQQAYGQSLYGAQSNVLQGLAGAGQAAVSQKQGLRADTTNALSGAYDRFVSHPGLWGAADTGGKTAAMNTAAVGHGATIGPGAPSPVTSAIAAGPRRKPVFGGRTTRQTVGFG